jgi:1-acyl-sn-glycerol-3-phosphate acyltransferase
VNPAPIAAPWAIKLLDRGLAHLASYHDYRVEGLEHVPATGPVLVAVNHSFASYDGFLLARAIYQATGRVGVGLGDNLMFKVPGLGRAVWGAGIRPANPQTGEALLTAGHLVYVAPGGMREALRPSSERYRVRWEKRRGFARLAVRAGVPLVLGACPGGDDIYDVRVNRLTAWAYRRHKVPLAWVTGRYGTVVPRRVPLVAYVAPPLAPPVGAEETFEARVEAFHQIAVQTMNALLERGRAAAERYAQAR